MTLTDTLLNEMAADLISNVVPNPYVGFSSTAIEVDPTDTSLSGEFGDRVSATGARVLNEVTFNAIKTGATVGSSGDEIRSFGLFDSSTAGNLLSEALVASILQTTTFDVEVDWQIKVERKG